MLQSLTLTIGECQILHNIRCLAHQNLVVGLSFLFEVFCISPPLLEKHDFSIFQKVQQNIKRSNIFGFTNLSHWTHRHFWQLLTMFLNICLHILTNLNHEDAIVTFRSDGCMCNRDIVAKFIDREVTLTTASLSANRGHSFEIPSIHSLVDAAEAEYFFFKSFRILIDILTHIMEKPKAD